MTLRAQKEDDSETRIVPNEQARPPEPRPGPGPVGEPPLDYPSPRWSPPRPIEPPIPESQ